MGGINLLLRFPLELAMVAAFIACGVQVADPLWLGVVFGLAAAALALNGPPVWSIGLTVIAGVNIGIPKALRLR